MDAELAFSRALELASEAGGDVALAALLGRGRVRYRIDRVADALADLAELRELAGSVGDAGRIAEALLEEAAAFDWAEQFDESESALSQAAPLVDQLGDAALSAQLLAARGRSHWRMSRPEQAVEQLARAAAADCDEARTIAATLLPLALLRCGRLDESEAQFSQAIELFESRGDLFHLAAILVNRMFLWSARQDPDRGRSDLRRAIEIARELGNPQLERGAVYNLAEDLYWSGIDDESLELAERARALRRKFWPEVVPIDELLLARIQAGQSDFDSARASLAETGWVQSAGAADSFSLLGAAVDRAVSSARWDVWEPLIEAADRALGADEALEVRYLCARSLLRNGQTDRVAAVVTGAGPGLARAPIWKRRFAALV
jgi:tetratricopeptide (TPR) repeat protein